MEAISTISLSPLYYPTEKKGFWKFSFSHFDCFLIFSLGFYSFSPTIDLDLAGGSIEENGSTTQRPSHEKRGKVVKCESTAGNVPEILKSGKSGM